MNYAETNNAIIARIRKGDTSAYDDLIRINDGLIHKYVNRLKEKLLLSHMFTYEDAYQTCVEAMLKNCLKYNPQEGAFSTFICWHFFSACEKERRDTLGCVRVPINQHGTEDGEKYLERYCKWESLEDTAYNEDEDEILNEDLVVTDKETDPLAITAFKELQKEILTAMITTLTPTERAVIVSYFGLNDCPPKTLEEIGTILRITRERVRQIKAKGLRKLYRCLREYKGFQTLVPPTESLPRKYYAFLALRSGSYIFIKDCPTAWFVDAVSANTIHVTSVESDEDKEITWNEFTRVLSPSEVNELGLSEKLSLCL